MTTSIIDYIFRELAVTYLGRTDLAQIASESELHTSPIDSISKLDKETDFDEEEIYSERIIEEDPRKVPADPDPLRMIPPGYPQTPQVKTQSDKLEMIKEAKLKGYSGDVCSSCGSFTMVRNGTCLKCTTCGETSGCS
jgi:ribonucleoside-diphosphate reductase alpha chain